MTTQLGFLGYVFITLFYPVQLVGMIARRNVDLGLLPMVSLIIGLSLVQYAAMRDGAPVYIRIGNAVAFAFGLAILILLLLGAE